MHDAIETGSPRKRECNSRSIRLVDFAAYYRFAVHVSTSMTGPTLVQMLDEERPYLQRLPPGRAEKAAAIRHGHTL